MSDPKDEAPRRRPRRKSGRVAPEKPAWADGIRQLYDAVTQEPLPTEFQKLLDELGNIPKE